MKVRSRKLVTLPKLTFSETEGVGLYRELTIACERMSEFLTTREGIDLPGLSRIGSLQDRFLAQNIESQRFQHQAMREFYEVCQEISKEQAFIDNKHSAKRHLWRRKLKVEDDVLEAIDNTVCVELYDVNLRQTFRTINFLRYIEHSLEELSILPYYEIFIRSEIVSERIAFNAQKILSGEHPAPMWNFIEPNIVKERGTTRVSRASTRCVAPVYDADTNEIVGLIHIFLIESQTQLKLLN
jgi:hypothetical protein